MHRITFSDGTAIEGLSPKEVLDRWNASPWWADYSPLEFRQRIVELTDADVDGGLPADDEEILRAVAEADPVMLYEPNAAASIAGLVQQAQTP